MYMNSYPKWATVEKAVGETPLVAVERLRESLRIPAGVPMAYAGRLDPMASGRLLVLIDDEWKSKKNTTPSIKSTEWKYSSVHVRTRVTYSGS